jgi:signal peptidase I
MSRRAVLVLIMGVLIPTLSIVLYLSNPWGSSSWNPVPRILGFHILRMPSASMEPTIRKGKVFIATGWPYIGGAPAIGDVVVFGYPPDPTVLYAKRIVAGGGSSVSVSKCLAVVDGRPLNEPYTMVEGDDTSEGCEYSAVQVPMGMYFVLSDNRLNGADSRHWGFVPSTNVFGRVLGL